MIFFNQGLKVFVHREPVDMKKGDGLASIVENHIKEDLLDGSVFLFVNKSRRLCKAIILIAQVWLLFTNVLRLDRS